MSNAELSISDGSEEFEPSANTDPTSLIIFPGTRNISLIDSPVVYLRNDCDIILSEIDRLRSGSELDDVEQKALSFTISALNGKYRKVSGEPFIVHPIDTSIRVRKVTKDRVVRVVALMHDDIEESRTDKQGNKIVTKALIAREFGGEIAELCDALTPAPRKKLSDPKSKVLNIITERDRKEKALKKVIDYPDPRADLIKSADVLSNMEDTFDDWSKTDPAGYEYRGRIYTPFRMPEQFIVENFVNATLALIGSYRRKSSSENPFKDELISSCKKLVYNSLSEAGEDLETYRDFLKKLKSA